MTTAYNVGSVPQIRVKHRLRIAREEAGLDQAQLAQLIGISRNSVSNAEKGTHEPRKIVLNAWALATGVPVHWLETGEAPHPTGPDEGLDSTVRHQGLEPRTRWLSESASEQRITDNVFPLPGTPSHRRPAVAFDDVNSVTGAAA